jgi:hypothetical protein
MVPRALALAHTRAGVDGIVRTRAGVHTMMSISMPTTSSLLPRYRGWHRRTLSPYTTATRTRRLTTSGCTIDHQNHALCHRHQPHLRTGTGLDFPIREGSLASSRATYPQDLRITAPLLVMHLRDKGLERLFHCRTAKKTCVGISVADSAAVAPTVPLVTKLLL